MGAGIAIILAGLASLAAGQVQEQERPAPPFSLIPVPPPVVLPPPPRPTIVNPVWVRRPTPDYPDVAFTADIPHARVLLECDVRTDGTIMACVVTDETPAGYGFGEAARTAAVQGIVQPWVENGVAIEALAWVTVDFILKDEADDDRKDVPEDAVKNK